MRRMAVLGVMTMGVVLLATARARPQDPRPVREAVWLGHLRAMDRALEARDVRAAERAWHEAYLTALGTWEWEGMVDVAAGYLRLARISGPGRAAMARARNFYLAALFRARQQQSIEGLLRTAEGFVRVGDRTAAEHALRVAEGVAAEVGDKNAPARIRAFAATLARVPTDTPEAGR